MSFCSFVVFTFSSSADVISSKSDSGTVSGLTVSTGELLWKGLMNISGNAAETDFNYYFFFCKIHCVQDILQGQKKKLCAEKVQQESEGLASFNLLSPSMIVFDIIILYRNKSSN